MTVPVLHTKYDQLHLSGFSEAGRLPATLTYRELLFGLDSFLSRNWWTVGGDWFGAKARV
jgi:hypothetical protein